MRALRLLFPLKRVAESRLPAAAFFSSSAIDTKSTNCVAIDAIKNAPVRRNRPKIKWQSASYVGTVEEPLRVNTKDGKIVRAWTFLRAKVSPDSDRTFRILIKLWEEMAESNLERLKPNDVISVAGTLESHKKDIKSGKSYLACELDVSELNYIKQCEQGSKTRIYEGVRHEEGNTWKEKNRERLHLWQVFFSSPYEWWDNRNKKSNLKQPDFKHKSTGECLWLNETDPPWVRKQLELIDSKQRKNQDDHFGSDYSMSKWLDS